MLHQAVFHSFVLDDREQDIATTAAHIKLIMELLQNRNVLMTKKVIYERIKMDVPINRDAQLHYIFYKCCLMHKIL